MDSDPHTLVYTLLAPLVPTTDGSIEDANLLDELGLDALDLVLVAIKLEELEPERGSFPLAALQFAKSVGDLVLIVDFWWSGDAPTSEGRPAI
jgi:hypothetical protein